MTAPLITDEMVENALNIYWRDAAIAGSGTVEEYMRRALEAVADDIVERCIAEADAAYQTSTDDNEGEVILASLKALKRNSPDPAP